MKIVKEQSGMYNGTIKVREHRIAVISKKGRKEGPAQTMRQGPGKRV